MGIYISPSGNIAGPWRLGASSKELGASPGNALGFGSAYSPGIQAWYNQFIGVDPKQPAARLRWARGGLRVHRRRSAMDDHRPVLELHPALLRAGRPDELPAHHPPGSACRRLRQRPGLGG